MRINSEVNPTSLERRDLLKGLAVVLGAALTPACQRAVEVPAAQRVAGVARWSIEQRAIAHRCADLKGADLFACSCIFTRLFRISVQGQAEHTRAETDHA